MNKISVLALVLSVVAVGVAFSSCSSSSPSSSKETSYDRVVRTHELRCGYGTWKPGVYKDAKTGEMKGLFVDLINAMGRLNDLDIKWEAEVDWGQIPEALRTGKIDAFCAGMANDAKRGILLVYSDPLSYWTFDVLVRADDQKFPKNTIKAEKLNDPAFASAYSEGDVLETIVKNEFPKARGIALPPLGTPADNVMYLTTRKTDFIIFPKIMFQAFEAENPGKLRYLKVDPPLRAYGNVIAVNIDELKLQQLINAGVRELVNSGTYARIMNTYDAQYPGAFLRVKAGYEK